MESLYFVAVVLPTALEFEIKKIKEEIARDYNSRHALRSPAHITLHMPFRWKDKKKDKLIHTLSQVALHRRSFELTLKDFGCFRPRVIYINVAEELQLNDLQESVATHFRNELHILNSGYKSKGFHPHVTVAFRDLRKSKFHQAWEKFENMRFEGAFKVNDIGLLKHDGHQWNPDQFFSFSESTN